MRCTKLPELQFVVTTVGSHGPTAEDDARGQRQYFGGLPPDRRRGELGASRDEVDDFTLSKTSRKDRMMHDQDELIETINLWQLRQVRWPLMRILSPHFVAEVELGRYMKRLLGGGRWSIIRVVPR